MGSIPGVVISSNPLNASTTTSYWFCRSLCGRNDGRRWRETPGADKSASPGQAAAEEDGGWFALWRTGSAADRLPRPEGASASDRDPHGPRPRQRARFAAGGTGWRPWRCELEAANRARCRKAGAPDRRGNLRISPGPNCFRRAQALAVQPLNPCRTTTPPQSRSRFHSARKGEVVPAVLSVVARSLCRSCDVARVGELSASGSASSRRPSSEGGFPKPRSIAHTCPCTACQ